VKKNTPFERSTFNRAKQQAEESIEQFTTRLRKLSLYCEYRNTVDEHIRDKIIDGCSSQKLRYKLLTEENVFLQKAIELGKMKENADRKCIPLQKKQIR